MIIKLQEVHVPLAIYLNVTCASILRFEKTICAKYVKGIIHKLFTIGTTQKDLSEATETNNSFSSIINCRHPPLSREIFPQVRLNNKVSTLFINSGTFS